jgi:muconolactone delta-isomerase
MGDLFKPKTKEEANMPKKVFLTLVLIASLLSLIWLASSQSTASKSLTKTDSSPASSMPSKEAICAKLTTLERGWVKNEGQWDERALFSAPGYFGTTWITKDGQLVHTAVKGKDSWVISERWVGGKVQVITPEEELPTKVSFFVGNDPSKHKTNLPTYRYISLGEVWSGVEVKLKATQKTVEKLFYVKPGADPSKIVVEVDGAKGLRLSKNGEIIIQTGLGELKLSKPIAWQEKGDKKLPVEVSYKLLGKNRYSFVVAKADPSLPIVIDPILQATYLGGNSRDEAYALAIHPQTGEIYVAGYTLSSNFPKTAGGAQTGCISCINDLPDIFVARLNLDLTQILQVTYLGGRSRDEAYALAIHPTTGEVYVVGATNSTDFPKTTGGVQANKHRNYDAFVARLNSNLNQILQSTYLGGSERDEAHAIAIHPATGEVYVAGYTYSNDFPKTDGGARTYNDGDFDVFVARLNKELTRIFQSTYLGGRDFDFAKALVIHPRTGDVYVAGETKSTSLPNTTNGAQAAYGGGDYDAFVARLNSDLTKILQSTYLGGKGRDSAYALAIHPETGDVYVAGETKSTDFPNTTGGAQAGYGGGYKDAFVVRLNSNLNQILQSTYLGGNDWDEAYALAIHPKTGDVYVAGYTKSTDFPNTTGGAQAGYGGGYKDAFVARLNSNLTQILQSTYLGGLGWDEVNALAIHPKTGEVYAAGRTSSSGFPKTTGGAQVNNGGDWDAFVARLTADLAASRSSGGGGVSLMTASASSTTSFWSILLLLSVPTFALARRIRRR